MRPLIRDPFFKMSRRRFLERSGGATLVFSFEAFVNERTVRPTTSHRLTLVENKSSEYLQNLAKSKLYS